MKQCPSCRSTYTDETLRYCLADGTTLTDSSEEQTIVNTARSISAETEVLHRGEQLRVEIPSNSRESVPSMPAGPPTNSAAFLKILLVIAVLGILVLAVAGVAGLIYYNSSSGGTIANNARSVTETPTPDQTGELRDQIANLERRIREQRNTKVPANTSATTTDRNTRIARVNSPGDGFLALRTLPNSESGERIAKIPHGAEISIGYCGPVVTPVRRSGRWCQATYNGSSGWVFDAYLIYSSPKQ